MTAVRGQIDVAGADPAHHRPWDGEGGRLCEPGAGVRIR